MWFTLGLLMVGNADGSMPSEACVLCDVASGKPETPFVGLFRGSRSTQDQIVLRFDGVFVMVDCAPIVPGHLLIVSEGHDRSLAAADLEVVEVVRALASTIDEQLSPLVGTSYVFFEHGPSADLSETGGCGIDHLHLHALPVPEAAIEPVLEELRFRPLVGGLASLPEEVGDGAYLYLATSDRELISTGFPGGSQVLRRSLASSLQDETVANWHDMVIFPDELGTRERVQAGLDLAAHIQPGSMAPLADADCGEEDVVR